MNLTRRDFLKTSLLLALFPKEILSVQKIPLPKISSDLTLKLIAQKGISFLQEYLLTSPSYPLKKLDKLFPSLLLYSAHNNIILSKHKHVAWSFNKTDKITLEDYITMYVKPVVQFFGNQITEDVKNTKRWAMSPLELRDLKNSVIATKDNLAIQVSKSYDFHRDKFILRADILYGMQK